MTARATPNRITGVTLAGTPAVVVGSNTHVAWGFTNSYGDWTDLVILEMDGDRYLTPDGPRDFEFTNEEIRVRDGRARDAGGQVDHLGTGDRRGPPGSAARAALDRPRAPRAPTSVSSISRTSPPSTRRWRRPTGRASHLRTSSVADSTGRIGWTIIGTHPQPPGLQRPGSDLVGRRLAILGRLALARRLPADPRSGGRDSVDGEQPSGLAARCWRILGDGGFDLGARARQIRDDLLALSDADEEDMLAIQLDDRALFLERWRGAGPRDAHRRGRRQAIRSERDSASWSRPHGPVRQASIPRASVWCGGSVWRPSNSSTADCWHR